MALSLWTRAYWNSFVLWHARDESSLPYRDSFLIRAVTAGTSQDGPTRDRLVKTLLDQLGGGVGSVEVDFVPSLPTQPSGKVKAVISKC